MKGCYWKKVFLILEAMTGTGVDSTHIPCAGDTVSVTTCSSHRGPVRWMVALLLQQAGLRSVKWFARKWMK